MLINKYTYFIILSTVIVFLIIWIAYSNTVLEINTINIESKHLPTEFNGFRIAQISDLHNAEFGNNNSKLISMLKQVDADIIVITGDVIDSRRTDVDIAILFAEQAVEIAPTYYVNGNHEARIPGKYEKMKQGFVEAGVIVLENSSVDFMVGEETISLVGISDPTFNKESVEGTMESAVINQLLEAVPDNENYKILLAHRPEYINEYVGKVDLVFSGHAHGGQFVIPFVGGLVAPGQGLFPKYYDGLYTHDTTSMIVSRGIGNSIFPFRINNRPEIVVAELTELIENE